MADINEKMKNYICFEFKGIPQNESLARSVAAAFIAPYDPSLEEIADVRTAVSEAVTNAIIHGYRDRGGSVVMECSLDGSLLTVTITDRGRGITDIKKAMQPFYTEGDESERTGMGFAVMQAFMDELLVESTPGKGTKVMLRKRLFV